MSKNIQVNSEALDFFASRYYNDVAATCTEIKTYEDFYNEQAAIIDVDDCNITCETCVDGIIAQYGLKDVADLNGDGTHDLEDEKAWQKHYDDCMAPCSQPTLCDVAYDMMLLDVSPGGQYWGVNSASPNWNVSILNDQKVPLNAFPNWSSLFDVTSPMYSYTAQQLEDNWEDEWAEILIQNHPEWCYYNEWCGNLNTEHNTNNLTSSQFSELLSFVGDYSSAASINLADPNYVFLYGTSAVSTTNFSLQSLTSLIAQDPFFYASGYANNSPGRYGENYRTTFENAMENYNGFTNVDLFDYVAYNYSYGRWYGNDQPSATSGVFSSLMNNVNISQLDKDKLYDQVIAMYNAERTNYMQKMMQDRAIFNQCYNGAFSNVHFNPFMYKFFDIVGITNGGYNGLFGSTPASATYNGYFDYQNQESSLFTSHLYESKQPRFMVAADYYPTTTDPFDYAAEANAGYYAETGRCPMSVDLELLLNDMVASNSLTTTKQLHNFGAYTFNMYNAITGTDFATAQVSSFIPVGYIPAISGSTLNGNVDYTTNFSGNLFTLTPTGTMSGFTAWSNITSFSQLTYTSDANGVYTFSVMGVYDNGGTLEEVVFEGTTAIKIGRCEAEVLGELGTGGALDKCTPNATALELLTWINIVNSDPSQPFTFTFNSTTPGGELATLMGYSSTTPITITYNNGIFTSSNGNAVSIVGYNTLSTNTQYLTISPTYTMGDLILTYMTTNPNLNNMEEVVELNLVANLTQNGITTGLNLGGCESKISDECASTMNNCNAYDQAITSFFNEVLTAYLNNPSGTSTVNITNPMVQSFFNGATSVFVTIKYQYNNRLLLEFNNCGETLEISTSLDANPTSWLLVNSIDEFRVLNTAAINSGSQVHPQFEMDLTIGASNQTTHIQQFKNCTGNIPCTAVCVPCIPTPSAPVTCANEWSIYDANNSGGFVTLNDGTVTNIPAIIYDSLFCDLGMQYIASDYVKYLTLMNVTTITSPFYVSMEDFGIYNSKHYYNIDAIEKEDYIGYVNLTGISSQTDPKFISVIEYTTYRMEGYSNNCIADYMVYRGTVTNSTPDILSIGEVCNSHAKNKVCFASDPLFIPTQEVENPCVEYLTNLIEHNAQTLFEEYVSDIEADFRRRYVEAAISGLRENFTVTEKDAEYHHTLYEYDQSGSLVRTIPPQGVNKMIDINQLNIVRTNRYNQSNGIINANIVPQYPKHKFATTYTYNTLNQLKKQRTPDGGISNFWYDALSRIILSQNAEQLINNKYSYSFYDALGRIVEAGQVEFPFGSPIETLVPNQIAFEQEINGNGNKSEITRTFYDESIFSNPLSNEHNELRNRIAHVTYLELPFSGLAYDYATHYLYDIHGNVSSMVQDYAELDYIGQRYKRVDYEYDLISGNVNKVNYQKGQKDEFFHEYDYDADNRIIYAKTSNNGIDWEEDANYQYYDHGPLARVETGDVNVQGTDFAYTIQGWLKGVNSNTLKRHRDMGKDGLSTGLNSKVAEDVFGFSLGYFNGDYKKVTKNAYLSETNFLAKINNNSTLTNNNLYNGNITHMATAIKPLMTTGNDVPQTMVYSYDLLNSIAGSQHLATQINAQNEYLQSATDNKYKTAYTYDQNGNITTLKRHDENGSLFDDFTYHYINDIDAVNSPTNRLGYVGDVIGDGIKDFDIDNQSANNYSYNKIGQLTSDVTEGISEIKWNNQGKVTEIIQNDDNPNTEFRYGPMGNRIVKIVKPKDNGTLQKEEYWTYTYYVRDAQGNVMGVYDNKVDLAIGGGYDKVIHNLKEHHIYGSDRMGIENNNTKLADIDVIISGWNQDGTFNGVFDHLALYSKDLNYFQKDIGDKNYECKNHLGNVLAVVTDRKLIKPYVNGQFDGYEADVVSYSSYYPFGMEIEALSANSSEYRYGFNGMEKDDEVKGQSNSYDYGARMYDNRLGRWLSIDPMAAKQPAWSPYKMANDNPVLFMDPDGNTEIFTVTINDKRTGKVTTMTVVVSEEVMTRMNIQTAVHYFHDIKHTVLIDIDKEGKYTRKVFYNQPGKKRGNWYSKWRYQFRSKNFQQFGFYMTSEKGEGGSTIYARHNLGSDNIDAILSLFSTLSSIQGGKSKDLKETVGKLNNTVGAVDDKLSSDPAGDNGGYAEGTTDEYKGKTIYGTDHSTNEETGRSLQGRTITDDSVTVTKGGITKSQQKDDFLEGRDSRAIRK